jgi:hypothetical protein
MTPQALLDELERLNVKLTLNGDKLQLEAPAGVLTPDLREKIRQHKPELITLLKKAQRVKQLLRQQGWVVIHSSLLNENVVWCRDETVSIPARLSGLPRYTLAEIKILTSEPEPSPDDLRLLHAAKKAFRGVFVEAV